MPGVATHTHYLMPKLDHPAPDLCPAAFAAEPWLPFPASVLSSAQICVAG